MQATTMRKESQGHCKKCGSNYTADFETEVCIHIPGPENLSVPAVFAFPKLAICLACGAVPEFEISADQLTELRRHTQLPSAPA